MKSRESLSLKLFTLQLGLFPPSPHWQPTCWHHGLRNEPRNAGAFTCRVFIDSRSDVYID